MASPPSGRYLYIPGDFVQAKKPAIIQATKSLLLDLGIPFITSKERGSGYPALIAGYSSEAKHQKMLIEREMKETKTIAIITNEPEVAIALRELPAFHIIELLSEHIDRLPKTEAISAYLHPFTLEKLGIEMRQVLRVMRRCGIHIPSGQKIHGGCAGAVYTMNNPIIAEKIAARYQKQITEKTIISTCPHCQVAFKGVKDIVEVLG